MSCAVVPVKALAEAKSRMLPDLARAERAGLSLAMLSDVLEALLATPCLDRVVVLTPDAEAAQSARSLGAEALLRPDPGLNAAIDAAAEELALGEAEPFLVVLGDVAGLESEDVVRLCRSLAESSVPCAALAASQDGGSSALLRVPHDALPACFGPDSARRHREAAHKAGVPLHELDLPSLALDLDGPKDVAQFLARKTAGGVATRRFLESVGAGVVE
mgnify:CR=1 FL=1